MSIVAETAQGDVVADTPVGTSSARRFKRFIPSSVLAITMVVTGATGLNYEYIISTVFTYLLGSSIEQFSLTIGIMIFMMGVGGLLQLKLRGPLVEYFVGAEILLAVLGGFAPIALQWAFATFPADFGWIKFAYPGLIGVLIGVEIPLAMRINARYASSLSGNIAGTWAWDYIGSFGGVILWLMLLRHYVPLTHISFYWAAANLFVAILSLVYFWRRGLLKRRWNGPLLGVTAVLVSIGLLFSYANVDAWGRMLSQKVYEDPIVLNVTTKFQNIVVTKGVHPSNPADHNWQLFLNGNKQFASADEAIYHEYLVHPAMNLAARRNHVLILGGGDGMAMREVLKYKDVTEVTLVDLDPGMVELARNNAILKRLNGNSFADARVHASIGNGVTDTGRKQDVNLDTGENATVCEEEFEGGKRVNHCEVEPETVKTATVNIYTVDADRFITDRPGYYDVVIVDLPDPNSVELAKLYSREFYEKVRRVVSPDGMVVVQSTSPYHAKETYLCVLRTMASAGLNVLPYHDNVPSFGDWGWILGSPNVKADTLYERADTMSAFGVPTREVEANNLTRALIFNRGGLTANSQEISTLMRPVVFNYYLHEAWKTD